MSNHKNSDADLQKRLDALNGPSISDSQLESRLSKLFGEPVSLKDKSTNDIERIMNMVQDEISLEKSHAERQQRQVNNLSTRLLHLQKQSILSDAEQGKLSKVQIKSQIYKIQEHIRRLNSWLKIASTSKSIKNTKGEISKHQSLLDTYREAYRVAPHLNAEIKIYPSVKESPTVKRGFSSQSLALQTIRSQQGAQASHKDAHSDSSVKHSNRGSDLIERAKKVDAYLKLKGHGQKNSCVNLLKTAIRHNSQAILYGQSKQDAVASAKKYKSLYLQAERRGHKSDARRYKKHALNQLKRAQLYGKAEGKFKARAHQTLSSAKHLMQKSEQQSDCHIEPNRQDEQASFRPR